jgi:hypothetical protein
MEEHAVPPRKQRNWPALMAGLVCALGLLPLGTVARDSPPAEAAAAALPAEATAAVPAPQGPAGLRVLVDVSGSMKQNDPENLRIAALRLLTGLLPPGIEAGVWLFGAKVEGLVKVASVDADWQERSRLLASRIHSRAAFTNIEAALAEAAKGWIGKPAAGPRGILLLTDGVVDVSRDPAESAASRARLLEKLGPKLAEAGIEVHSIALSQAADFELLSELAARTGGRAIQVDRAEQLDRAFLRLLEGSSPREGLPVDDPTLLVDSAVRELTILAFRQPAGPPLTLESPSGQTIAPPNLPPNVRWVREAGYDLVTITGPEPGKWFMNTPSDPDNRALIVSDLALEMDELPSQLRVGTEIAVGATLTEKGAAIENEDFLKLIDVNVELGLEGAHGAPVTAALERHAGSSRYAGVVLPGDVAGDYNLSLRVSGKTFERERRSRIGVLPVPVRVEVAGLAPDDPGFRFFVEPTGEAPMSLRVEASVLPPDGEAQTVNVKGGDGMTLVEVPKQGPGIHEIRLRASGKDAAGQAFEITLGPYWLEALAAEQHADPAAPVQRSNISWARVAWQVGAVNAVLLVVGFFVYRTLRQRKQRQTRQFASLLKPAHT